MVAPCRLLTPTLCYIFTFFKHSNYSKLVIVPIDIRSSGPNNSFLTISSASELFYCEQIMTHSAPGPRHGSAWASASASLQAEYDKGVLLGTWFGSFAISLHPIALPKAPVDPARRGEARENGLGPSELVLRHCRSRRAVGTFSMSCLIR